MSLEFHSKPQSRRSGGARLAPWVLSFSAISFVVFLWVGHFVIPEADRIAFLKWLLISVALPVPAYLLALSQKYNALSWKLGAVLVFTLTLASSSFLQTDQLRYLLDGFHVAHGINPFRWTPSEALSNWKDVPLWAKNINHPELPTVYPPLAQLAFGVAGFLNDSLVPFWQLANHSAERLGLGKLPSPVFWQAETGWRLVLACSGAYLVYVLRRKRWDLVVFHPLFLLTAVANVHLDALFLVPLALLLSPLKVNGVRGISASRLGIQTKRSFFLAAGVLIRWMPLLWIPQLLVHWQRRPLEHPPLAKCFEAKSRSDSSTAFFGVGFAIALIALGWAFFLPGSGRRLFESSLTYTEHWYFFGFLHRFASDTLTFAWPNSNSIQTSKFLLGGLFLTGCALLTRLQFKSLISFRAACVWTYVGFLAISPTLHPWYLLPLIVVGLPYLRILPSLWIWPMLAPLSYFYYFESKDPQVLRVAMYLGLSVFLVVDFRRVYRQIRRTLNFRRSQEGAAEILDVAPEKGK